MSCSAVRSADATDWRVLVPAASSSAPFRVGAQIQAAHSQAARTSLDDHYVVELPDVDTLLAASGAHESTMNPALWSGGFTGRIREQDEPPRVATGNTPRRRQIAMESNNDLR